MNRYILLLILCVNGAIISCKKIDSDNPFDPNCPKELFTPANLSASQGSCGIELNWNFVPKNISGYKLKRSIDNGPLVTIANFPKESTNYCDTLLLLGKQYKYSIVAYAGNNESNSTDAFFSPRVLVKTASAENITTNSASLGGIINVANGSNNITTRGISYRIANSNGNSSISQQGGDGSFNMNISNLLPNTTYYYKAFAINNQNSWFFGQEVSFTTNSVSLATVVTSNPIIISTSYAILGGMITENGGATITESGVVLSLNPNPTILNPRITNNSVSTSYVLNFLNLAPNTNYFARAYAINSSGVSYGNVIMFTTLNPTTNTVVDIDGNVYKTIVIGNQTWMAENLRVTKYKNGVQIANITDWQEWFNNTTGAWCYYDNDDNYNIPYGKLYNWSAVNSQNGLAPQGWHVPTDAEWTVLVNFLGGESIAGSKMKSIGTFENGTGLWLNPNELANNTSGFEGIPGGYYNQTSQYFRFYGNWWTSTESTAYDSWSRALFYNDGAVARFSCSKKNHGISVRCVKN